MSRGRIVAAIFGAVAAGIAAYYVWPTTTESGPSYQDRVAAAKQTIDQVLKFRDPTPDQRNACVAALSALRQVRDETKSMTVTDDLILRPNGPIIFLREKIKEEIEKAEPHHNCQAAKPAGPTG